MKPLRIKDFTWYSPTEQAAQDSSQPTAETPMWRVSLWKHGCGRDSLLRRCALDEVTAVALEELLDDHNFASFTTTAGGTTRKQQSALGPWIERVNRAAATLGILQEEPDEERTSDQPGETREE